MTWLRRNWPDLLIVLFILILIAGFVVVLMGGGSGRLLGGQNGVVANNVTDPNGTETPASTPQTVPAAPSTTPKVETVQTPTPTIPTPSSNSSNSNNSSGTDTTTGTSTGTSTITKPVETPPSSVPIIPAAPVQPAQKPTPKPVESVPQTSTDTSGTTGITATTPITTPVTTPITTPTTEQPTPPAQPRVSVSRSGIPTKADYRISAGLYSSDAEAQRVAAKIEARGYPAYVLPSKDDTKVVLIGPFNNSADANTALVDISRVHRNLFIYAPSRQPSSDTTSTATDVAKPSTSTTPLVDQTPAPDQTTPSGSSVTAEPATPAVSNTPAGSDSPKVKTALGNSGPVTLQVGAYRKQASVDALVDKLRSAGFPASVRTNEDGLMRVVVGPYSEANLEGAKSRLAVQGFDSFALR